MKTQNHVKCKHYNWLLCHFSRYREDEIVTLVLDIKNSMQMWSKAGLRQRLEDQNV